MFLFRNLGLSPRWYGFPGLKKKIQEGSFFAILPRIVKEYHKWISLNRYFSIFRSFYLPASSEDLKQALNIPQGANDDSNMVKIYDPCALRASTKYQRRRNAEVLTIQVVLELVVSSLPNGFISSSDKGRKIWIWISFLQHKNLF